MNCLQKQQEWLQKAFADGLPVYNYIDLDSTEIELRAYNYGLGYPIYSMGPAQPQLMRTLVIGKRGEIYFKVFETSFDIEIELAKITL